MILEVARKTSRKRWMIETGGERESGRSMLAAQHDDDDDIYIYIYIYIYICRKTDNNDPSGRNDLLTGWHYSVSVLLNHHQDHEGWY